MSQRARRIAAIVFCVATGAAALVAGTEMLRRGPVLGGVGLLMLSGFVLLSAVGLAKPYLPRLPLGRGTARHRGR